MKYEVMGHVAAGATTETAREGGASTKLRSETTPRFDPVVAHQNACPKCHGTGRWCLCCQRNDQQCDCGHTSMHKHCPVCMGSGGSA